MAFALSPSLAANEETRSRDKPAYLVASWKVIHPNELQPFTDAAVPLAQKAGYVSLGGGQPQVLEGRWPEGTTLIVQRYRSMQALLDFWHSPEHATAVKLREPHIESHFVVAVEAQGEK
jgi:uncharacterized protein (DUF1330 family)